jgi:histidyl-tRNA synthetase
MKRADKLGARVALIMGEDELKNQQVTVKNLQQMGEQVSVSWQDVTATVIELVEQ